MWLSHPVGADNCNTLLCSDQTKHFIQGNGKLITSFYEVAELFISL